MRLALRVLCLLLLLDAAASSQEVLRMYDPHQRITKTPQKGLCDVPRPVRKEISAFLVNER